MASHPESMSREQGEEESNHTDHESLTSWIETEEGAYIAKTFLPNDELYITDEFREYAERTSSSWSFYDYIWVVAKQYLNRLTESGKDGKE